MKRILYTLLLAGTFVFSSCTDELNQIPHIETTSANVYNEPANYKQVLAKLYASFVING